MKLFVKSRLYILLSLIRIAFHVRGFNESTKQRNPLSLMRVKLSARPLIIVF